MARDIVPNLPGTFPTSAAALRPNLRTATWRGVPATGRVDGVSGALKGAETVTPTW
jgi:hypothetical protein